MPIHRYAKVLLLAPPIGSALIGVLGLALAIVLISGRARPVASNPGPGSAAVAAATALPASRPVAPSAASAPWASGAPARAHPASAAAVDAGAPQRPIPAGVTLSHAIFRRPLAGEQLTFLTRYAGRASNDVVHEEDLRNLVTMVAPYAQFHLGVDMPLSTAIEGMFEQSVEPVQVRDGRYAMVFGRRSETGRGRALLWVDMQQGIGLGAIFFYPSNGEPTPSLTIFSRQIRQRSVRLGQLPPAFMEDLARWSAITGIPQLATRYFVNVTGEKTVLPHDEDFCKPVQGMVASPAETCSLMNEDAGRIDRQASRYLAQTNYASNATMRMVPAGARAGIYSTR